MTRQLTRLATGLTGAILTVVLLAGPPWLLTTYVGPPLPASWPDLDTLRSIATTGVTDAFVVTTLAVIVWIAWAQLATAVVIEALVALRRRPRIRLPLFPGTQPLAAKLVAATLLLVTTVQPRPLAVGAPFEVPAATVVAEEGITGTVTPMAEQTDTSTRVTAAMATVVTGERDSWWSLAEQHLGEGLRWREIRSLNLDRTVSDRTTIGVDTDQLESGWSLLVPASDALNTPLTELPEPEASEPVPDPSPQWEVQGGDHFWRIAEVTLEESWGRAPTDQETVSYWQELIDVNRERLAPPGDPDLIYPGQRFHLPDPPSDPTAEVADGDDQSAHLPIVEADDRQVERDVGGADAANTPFHDAGTQTPEPQADIDALPSELEGASSPAGPAGQAQQPELPDARHPARNGTDDGLNSDPRTGTRADAPSAATSGWEHTLSRGSATAGPIGDRLDLAPSPLDHWSSLVTGVAASGLAAAGVLHLLHRRRRVALQQRPFATRLPTPAPETISHLGRLAAAAPHDDATLDDLTDLLTSIPPTCQPALVTVTGAGEVRLLFADDDEPGEAVGPWRLLAGNDDQPVGWTATLGDTGPRRSVGLPLLVTLGQTAGQTVLANLGRLGHLPISGRPYLARRIMSASAMEVATSRTAGPVQVHTTGQAPHVALDQIVRVDDLSRSAAVHLAEREQGVIDDDRTALLLIADTDNTDLPTLPSPGDRFLGLLHRCAQPPSSGWLLAITDEASATLHLPDGGLVTLDLPELDPAIIRQELDRLDRPPQTEPHTLLDDDGQGPASEPPGEPEDEPAGGPAVEGQAAPPPPTGTTPTTGALITPRHPASANGAAPGHTGDNDATVEVRILGPVEVFRDGEPLEGLSPLILEILVYLATHRDGVSPERLDDAIWAGQAAKPGNQRLRSALTKLRDTLGPGPDGEPLLPRRRSKSDLVHLTAHVRTDLDAAVHHLEQAHATTGDDRLLHLDRAIALVRGEPFEGWPRSWASEITSRAISQLQDAAAAAAAGHRRRGEHDEAEASIRTGLKLCDPCEILYVEWGRLEAARGRRDQIPRILQRLNNAYDRHADELSGWVATPTRETRQAFAALLEPDEG